mmetsp:Transcript_4732/g.11768  ORF Transcript_4732/g.11768 Transcript_4732/m.11768 type:complete len:194 (-) Transcript_4732:61-642(-)|eukprot:CAMPEP_0174242968 /NCGR_PEP_ID=MMETSP0417-20130205/29809_1 /TAXON_ID=242541 /ORGANISM="Mayorella sp, Strain BSH-02190019" /LENGTH=193 /DNA_ID=CAMNT_0015322417 /DNA_START=93 /DNA_END=674 /DNA_ORIENTATION=-
MNTWRKKVLKKQPSGTDQAVAQALYDLEITENELQSEVKDLYLVNATEVPVAGTGGSKKVIVIVVPYILLNRYHKVQHLLVQNLEKKFSGKHIVIIAQRRILPKETRLNRKKRQLRPRSRTLTKVHESILDDILYPAEIVRKQVHYGLDGSKTLQVQLDAKDQTNAESKLQSYSTVYKKLTGKSVTFSFAVRK